MSKPHASPASATRQLVNLLRCLYWTIQTRVINPESAKLHAGNWPRRLAPTETPILSDSRKLPRDKAYSNKVPGLLSLNWFQDLDSVLPVVEEWLKRQADVDPGIDEFYRLKCIRTTASCLHSRLYHGYRESELLDGLKPPEELAEEICWWANTAFDWEKSFAVSAPAPPKRAPLAQITCKIVPGDRPGDIHRLVILDDQPAAAHQNAQPAKALLDDPSAKALRDDRPAEAKQRILSKDICRDYLLYHHGYHVTVAAYELNQTPATPTEMDKKNITSDSSATRFFRERWGSHDEYTRICNNPNRLLIELQLLAGDMPARKLAPLVADIADQIVANRKVRRKSIDEND